MRKTKGEVRRLPRGVKLLSIAAALVLTCVLAVSLIGTGFAADTTTVGEWTPVEGIKLSVDAPSSEYDAQKGDNYSEWTASGSQATGDFALTGTVYSKRQKKGGDTFDAKSRTLVITNTNTAAVTLKFQWTEKHTWFDTSSVTCDVEGFSTGTFNASIPAGESKSVVITSAGGTASGITNKDNPTQSITLSNFSVVQSDIYNLTLLPAENGTYSATNGTGTVNSSEKDETITYDPTSDKVTLTATEATGYKFYLWEDENHTPISTANPLTNYGPDSKGNSIRAVFVKSNMEASYHIGNADYHYWEDAMRVAAASTGETSVVVDNSKHAVTLPTSAADASRYAIGDCKYVAADAAGALTYVIPSGVKLVVPYNGEHDTAVNTLACVGEGVDEEYNEKGVTDATTGVAYATLTVPEPVTIAVNKGGTLLVNAIQGSATNDVTYQSHVVGASYGKMEVFGTIVVEGDLYARGYVVDGHYKDAWDSATRTGRICVKPGGTIYQMLQMRDWRGGSFALFHGSKVAPLTMYYLQNDMVETTYMRGAAMKAQLAIVTPSNNQITATDPLSIISNGENQSLFVMSGDKSAITTRYDYAEDKLHVELNGAVAMNYLKFSLGMNSLDTSKLQLAISDNLAVTVVNGGTMIVNYGLKFLPGASLTVEEGAELIISDKTYARLYFYAKQDYQSAWSAGKFRTHLDAAEVIKTTGTVTPVGDAQLNLAGTLTVNGVLSFSTNHQSGLTAAGPNAKVVVNKLPTTAQKTIKEANGTNWKKEAVATSANWQNPAGPMVNDGAVTAFEKGATYTAVPAENGTYNWTRYTLNINYVDATTGNAVSGLTPKALYSADGTVSFAAPEGYAITNIQASSNSGLTVENATTVDDGKTKLANAVTDGCTDVTLSNITADGTITVTVKKYDHTVRWNFADAKSKDVTHTFMSYLASDETQAVRAGIKGGVVDATGAVTIKTAAGAAFDDAGSSINTGKDPFEVTVTGINKDAVATVLYSASRSVMWNVTMDGKVIDVPKTEIKNGSEATYNLNQDGERWQVVETSAISCTDNAVTVMERANTDDITVTGVYGDVTVNIAITTYAHKVSGTITTVNGETSTPKTITPFFTNETTYSEFAPDGSGKYIVSDYVIKGGTLDGKTAQTVSTILPDAANVTLTDKTVDIKLTFQSYVAVWQWNAAVTGATNVPADLSYTEYLTDKPNGKYENPWNPGIFYGKYRTLRSNGTEGWYYAELSAEDVPPCMGIAYTIPEGQRYVLRRDATEEPTLTSDRGSTKLNSWYYDSYTQSNDSWTLDFLGVGAVLNADMPSATVTVNLVPYAYDVTFTDEKGTVLEKFCAAADGKNAANGEEIYFSLSEDRRFVRAYEIKTTAGSPSINGIKGSKQDNVGIPMNYTDLNPYRNSLAYGCTLTGVEADTTVKLTLDSYERIAVWKWTVGDTTEQQITFLQSHRSDSAVSCYQAETSQFTKWTGWAYKPFSEGATAGYCPQFTIPDNAQYYIASANNGSRVSTNAKNCESEPDTIDSHRVIIYSFTLVPYDASLTWSVDGGAKQYMYINNTDSALNYNAANYNADTKTWTYYPDDGKLIKSFTSSSCTVNPAADKLSLAVTDLQADSTVSIVTQQPTTALAGYYMGDMSFEWVRNAAIYTFDADGTTASWKPVDSFVWRHAAGSKSFTLTDDDTITVANGSIYFINPTSTAKTYTIKLERTGNAAASALKLMVGGQVVEDGSTTITIPKNASQTVVCTLSGTPTAEELATGGIGHITVTESNG